MFDSTDYTVIEDVDFVTLSIVKEGATNRDIDFSFTTHDGTATSQGS